MVNVSNSTVKNIFENNMISKLIKKTGPLQCGIYNLGQLSKQYVLIRLGRPTKIGVKRGYYFFSLIPFGDKVLSFLIQKLSLSCLLLSSQLELWSIMVTFSLQKESWWPIDLRYLLSGRSGLQFASLLWPFNCCLLLHV